MSTSTSARFKQWLAVLHEPDAEMSKIAADKLGEIGNPEAVPDLISTLERRTAFVATAAAHALGKLGDKRAVPPLLHALNNHHDLLVKTAAAEALGNLRATEAVTALKKVVQEYLEAHKSDHFSKTRSFQRGLFTTSIAALKKIGTRDALRFATQAESYSRSN